MKKNIIYLTALLALLLLSACGQTQEDAKPAESPETATASEQTEAEETPEEPAAEETDAKTEETETATEEPVSEDEPASEESDTEITETVWLYFSDEQLLNVYRVEAAVSAPSEEELPLAALNSWLDGSSVEGLYNLVPEDTKVLNVTAEDKTAVVSFSPELLDATLGSSGEQLFTEQVAMIMQQFGFDQTKITIDGEETATFFGHIDATKPITAGTPEDYQIKE